MGLEMPQDYVKKVDLEGRDISLSLDEGHIKVVAFISL